MRTNSFDYPFVQVFFSTSDGSFTSQRVFYEYPATRPPGYPKAYFFYYTKRK